MNKIHRIFFIILLFSTIICFGTSKMLPYMVPFLSIALLFYRNKIETDLFYKSLVLSFSIIILFIYYLIIYPEFEIINYILAIITYGSFIPLFLINRKLIISHNLYIKSIKFISLVTIIEGSIGIAQYIYMFNLNGWHITLGDVVEGTIHLPPVSAGGFNNPIYVINMIFMVSFLSAFKKYYVSIYKNSRLIRFAIVIGVIPIFLGAVVHAIIFFILSMIITSIFLYRKKIISTIKRKRVIFILLFSTIVMINYQQYYIPHISLIKYYYTFATKYYQYFPKIDITIQSITDIPKEKPEMVVAGLGPGQFSSRASLILSGYYIGGKEYSKRNQLNNKSNSIMEKYLLPMILNPKTSIRGSTSKPYYSFLSLYTELGLIGIFTLLFIIFRILNNINNNYYKGYHRLKYLFIVQVVFLLLLGLQENYWELTQAVFPGLLLMKLEYSAL